MESAVNGVLRKYDVHTSNVIKDFLISEIDDENIKDTIEFVKSDDNNKKRMFAGDLYAGNEYSGIFLEGNQYLIGSNGKEVTIIDVVSEANGLKNSDARIRLPLSEFILLITNKGQVLDVMS